MATTNGKSGVLLIGANVVGEFRGMVITETAEPRDASVLNDDANRNKAGVTSWEATCEAWYDKDDTGQSAIDINAELAIEIHPEGTGSGLPSWAGNVVVTNIENNWERGATVGGNFSFVGDGALDKSGVQA